MIPRGRASLTAGLRWLSVLGWAGIIGWLVTLPSDEIPDIGFPPFRDKIGHAAVYGIWAILICWAAQKSFRALSRTGVVVLSLFAATLYGIVLELYQPKVGRHTDLLDVLANTTGAVLGCYVYFSSKVRTVLKRITSTRTIPVKLAGRPLRPFSARPDFQTTLNPAEQDKAEE